MAWKVEIAAPQSRYLHPRSGRAASRFLGLVHSRIVALDGLRSIGEALKGSSLGEFWKYRVGDYRIICSIEDGALRILVVRVGNRREVYR